MNRLASLTVRTRLIGSFLIVAALAAIIGAVGFRATAHVNAMGAAMYDVELAGLDHAATSSTMLVAAGRSIRSALLVQTLRERDAELHKLDERLSKVKSELDILDDLFVTAAGREMISRARSATHAYEGALDKVKTALKTEPTGEHGPATLAALEQSRLVGEAAEDLMREMVFLKRQNAQRFADEIAHVYTDTITTLSLMTAAGVLLALLLGWLLTRSLTRQLGGEPAQVATIASAIAQGDLTGHIDARHAAPGSVMLAMLTMQQSLRKLVASVLASSDSIASGSTQIAAGNTDLSRRTEEQAANLTETAAAMEELASTVQSNADVAQQAAQRAASASLSASRGGEVVNDVVKTMAGINDSSKRIVDIIGVIDSIAFQTNILALNAAVEAARAGEQGRGFAVVAAEVRSLAQKSASAAKDIKSLIDDSVVRVETGSRLVDSAGEAMQGIVREVQQVTDLMSEISAATKEQTTGLAQINDAVLQLSDVTQQNAALVEESATASHSLSEQADLLVATVGSFKVEHRQHAEASVQPMPAVSYRRHALAG